MTNRVAGIKIPTFQCKTGCTDCCGIAPFNDNEKDAAMQRFPLIQFERNEIAPETWTPSIAVETANCPFIKDGGCAIYDIRPLTCRLFGAVDDPRMECWHGCGPKKKLSETHSRQIIARHNAK